LDIHVSALDKFSGLKFWIAVKTLSGQLLIIKYKKTPVLKKPLTLLVFTFLLTYSQVVTQRTVTLYKRWLNQNHYSESYSYQYVSLSTLDIKHETLNTATLELAI
jgi:hypothetical protein